jgi:hypothetical protein
MSLSFVARLYIIAHHSTCNYSSPSWHDAIFASLLSFLSIPAWFLTGGGAQISPPSNVFLRLVASVGGRTKSFGYRKGFGSAHTLAQDVFTPGWSGSGNSWYLVDFVAHGREGVVCVQGKLGCHEPGSKSISFSGGLEVDQCGQQPDGTHGAGGSRFGFGTGTSYPSRLVFDIMGDDRRGLLGGGVAIREAGESLNRYGLGSSADVVLLFSSWVVDAF